jgi:hypothetical protein
MKENPQIKYADEVSLFSVTFTVHVLSLPQKVVKIIARYSEGYLSGTSTCKTADIKMHGLSFEIVFGRFTVHFKSQL